MSLSMLILLVLFLPVAAMWGTMLLVASWRAFRWFVLGREDRR